MAFGGRRDRGERSAEDRAHAAAERAARRAQPPPSPEVFQDALPPAGREPAYDPRRDEITARRNEPPEPAPDEIVARRNEPPDEIVARRKEPPEPAPDEIVARRNEPPDEILPRRNEPPDEIVPRRNEPRDEIVARRNEPPPDPVGWPRREPEAAASRGSAVTAVEDRPPSPRRVPSQRRPPRRLPPARRRERRGSWGRRIGALVALVAIGVALYVINATFQPFHGEGTGSVQVQVPENTDAGAIGDLLAERGVVASGSFFQLNATLTGRRGGLRPGDYTLRRDMSYGDAIAALEKGPKVKVVPTVDVTVPEGLSIREAAPVVDKGPLKGSYRRATGQPRVLRRIRRLGAPRGTDTAEGFMFPSTYTLVDGSPARDLVSKQLAAFKKTFDAIDMRYAKRKHLTRYDVLIIASMIEREIQVDRERPLAAAVIYNRLKIGETLGIDATLRYDLNNWKRPLKVSELESDTPYNTRLHAGLPPTPIGNPGRKSLEAAADPAREDYLFYVVKPCGNGTHAFSSTSAEFERDVARYDAARAERGGKSPADC